MSSKPKGNKSACKTGEGEKEPRREASSHATKQARSNEEFQVSDTQASRQAVSFFTKGGIRNGF